MDSANWCYTLACWWNDHESHGNWTWTPFTKLASKWYFYSSKLTGVSSDGVTPGSSRDTLMGLDCIHWILQQNLRIQRQAPEQKLCHKARWFYGIVTSRSFTYLEPSIAARSFGASLNIMNRISRNLFSHIIKLIPWAKSTVRRHFCWFSTMLNWFGTITKHSHRRVYQTSKILQKDRLDKKLHMIPGQQVYACM